MASKVWKGYLTFGLLNLPVYLNVAARDKRVELHTYHTECKGALKKPSWCPACEKIVPPDEVMKGYAKGKDSIVPITEAELDSITPETQRVMEINSCVEWAKVDPIYLAESFYLLPDDPGKKGYSLLAKVLADTGRVGIAQLTKSSREHVVLIRPSGQGLTAHYIWYDEEIARVPEFLDFEQTKLSANEIKLATQLVESMESEFEPQQYHDAYAARLTTLIASKLDKSVEAPAPVKVRAISESQDIMATLAASLKVERKRKPEPAPELPVKAIKKAKGKKVA